MSTSQCASLPICRYAVKCKPVSGSRTPLPCRVPRHFGSLHHVLCFRNHKERLGIPSRKLYPSIPRERLSLLCLFISSPLSDIHKTGYMVVGGIFFLEVVVSILLREPQELSQELAPF